MQSDRSQTNDRDFHFELRFLDDEFVEGVLDLDDGQLWIEPDRKQITINLSGEQVRQLSEWPSARERTKK